MNDWRFWARPNQIAPRKDFTTWLTMAGRGWGKTRVGAEWIRGKIIDGAKRVIIIAPTSPDLRDVVVEGESGLLSVCKHDANQPHYEPSKRRVTWSNGAQALLVAAEEPERLRGPQSEYVWFDELAACRYAQEAWDMMMFGMRLGERPQVCVTTTPKPIKLIRDLIEDPDCIVTTGSTYDNQANLPDAFFSEVRKLYEGTRLGRQELWAEILTASEYALWTHANLELNRVTIAPPMMRVVVAIDPAATSNKTSSETGIIVAGAGGVGKDSHGYVLQDKSGRFKPHDWATRAIKAFDDNKADLIVAETNNGGEMVEATLRTIRPNIPYRSIHASRGKRTRAEPIAALFEQCRCHMVGSMPQLEDQLCSWDASDGSRSPDRLDAMVWALTQIMKPYNPMAYGDLTRQRAGMPRRRM